MRLAHSLSGGACKHDPTEAPVPTPITSTFESTVEARAKIPP
jgi:hypothetical protein